MVKFTQMNRKTAIPDVCPSVENMWGVKYLNLVLHKDGRIELYNLYRLAAVILWGSIKKFLKSWFTSILYS